MQRRPGSGPGNPARKSSEITPGSKFPEFGKVLSRSVISFSNDFNSQCSFSGKLVLDWRTTGGIGFGGCIVIDSPS